MPFITNIRKHQNFFYQFFESAEDFIYFVKANILDKDTPISDDFVRVFYYAFNRRYRNVIVYEQEWFYQDFIMYFLDRKRKFELLYALWIEENDESPWDMINASSVTTSLHHGNDGQIQGPLALKDLTASQIVDEDNKEYATNASVDKTATQRLSKTNLINTFTRQDLREGFERFIETFSPLFSRMNAGEWNWIGYWETDFSNIPYKPDFDKEDTND